MSNRGKWHANKLRATMMTPDEIRGEQSAPTPVLPAIESMQRLRLEPEDVLVVKMPAPVSHEVQERIREYLAGLDIRNKVLVMDASVKLLCISPFSVMTTPSATGFILGPIEGAGL